MFESKFEKALSELSKLDFRSLDSTNFITISKEVTKVNKNLNLVTQPGHCSAIMCYGFTVAEFPHSKFRSKKANRFISAIDKVLSDKKVIAKVDKVSKEVSSFKTEQLIDSDTEPYVRFDSEGNYMYAGSLTGALNEAGLLKTKLSAIKKIPISTFKLIKGTLVYFDEIEIQSVDSIHFICFNSKSKPVYINTDTGLLIDKKSAEYKAIRDK